MRVERLKLSHLEELSTHLAPHQKASADIIRTPETFRVAGEYAWALIDDDDKVYAASGIVDVGNGRGQGWALMSDDVGVKRLRFLTRTALDVLAESPFRRVEVTVDTEFAEGTIWSLLLGFKIEGVMRSYSPDGRDHVLMARVKEE